MKISFLGGAYEVGASCILLKIYDKNILFDCGIRQTAAKDPLPDFRTLQEQGGVDAIIISHAHMDHIGSLPIISKEYPDARIYTNNMTKDLMKVLLKDSLKIMNNREAEIPLYAEVDVENMLNRIFAINYMFEFSIFEDVKLTFYNAGHIAGASCIYISTPEGSVFYSGDFSVFSQKTVEGLKIPKLRPDAVILETTYGDKLHSNREVEEEKLLNIIRECELNKSKILIPAFALGRAQEVLLIIKKAINKKYIKNIKVYVDGMIKDINRVYKLNPLYLKNSLGKKILRGTEPFYDEYIIPVDNKETREKILEQKEGCIIVSSSGMITGGPSQYYAEKIVSMKNGYIVITGYQDEESPGRRLLNLLDEEEDKRTIEINGKKMPVKCKVQRIGLSAHGDKGEIKSIINLLTPNNIFLVHGNSEVINSLAEEIAYEVRSNIYVPKSGESYDVNIKKPRKQWKKIFSKLLNESEDLDEDNIEKLWKFILENYSSKLLTVEELMYVWSGKRNIKISELDKIQKIIVKSVYFENDFKRLFLFKAKSKEIVEEETKERELKPNELTELVNKFLSQYNFKKASLMYNEKEVILSFDFPYVVDKSIYLYIDEFKKETGWDIKISTIVDINAVEKVVRELLGDADIKKISYMLQDRNTVVVTNSQYEASEDMLNKFRDITGMGILIQNGGKPKNLNNNIIEIEQETYLMEQNKALNFIDESFKNEEFKPYKKSIKQYDKRKYIELGFISPTVGKRYEEKINYLANETGWPMKLSSSINQNAIIQIACFLCNREQINLRKNPSFNPATLEVELKLESSQEEILEEIKKEFKYKTGCSLMW